MRISDWSSDVCSSDLVKATLRCKGRIGKQAEIGGGEIVDQPLPALQVVLHAHQRSVSPLEQRGIDLAVCLAEIDLLETADSEGGFMAVLVPEQPLEHLRPGKIGSAHV